MKEAYLAFDLGAESGRAMLGVLDGGRLALHELHRFANTPRQLPDGLHWNLLDLWGNVLDGLRKAGAHCRDNAIELASVGVDTWGVDYGLLGKSGQLLGLPFSYRDGRNVLAMERVLSDIGREKIYDATGIQFLPFNTLFQLVSQEACEPGMLDSAEHLAFIPDLLHYFLTGVRVCEATVASTSQMIDPRGGPVGRWATPLLAQLNLDGRMLGAIAAPGSEIGPVRAAIAEGAGIGGVKVIATASHDTASAIAAVPADAATSWCYLSSGTWSLMGVELPEPLINAQAMAANFTNERGIGGRFRFLRNIPGMWMIQQVRQDLTAGGRQYDYATLAAMASSAPALGTLVDPSYGPFMSPGGIISKIAGFAKATNQRVPASPGEVVRCCLESLAMEYRRTLGQLEGLLGRRLHLIHVVGGGARNELLNQMTADATGRSVLAGPFEATAAGNILVQAMGDGGPGTPAHIRRIVAASFDIKRYEPTAGQGWDEAYQRYVALLRP